VFPSIHFSGSLRPSQKDVVEIARRKLAAGKRRLHIVAPPGSGKTVLGLYLWAECIQCPAVVLSPNSAIQAQWAAKLDLFQLDAELRNVVSTDPQAPAALTSLTYQSVTLPRRGGEDLDADAIQLWQERLVEKDQAKDEEEAEVWIGDLRRHNPSYYEERLAAYRKEVRDQMALGGEALKTLHASSRATLERLRDRGVGLIILDECHHLMGHWGRVLADVRSLLGNPIVLGLTATPPDREGRKPEDVERYDEFFGEVDYEVPVPAVVKDGFLSPYQDLAYFVRPNSEELRFVANADEELDALVLELCHHAEVLPGERRCEESMPDWLQRVLMNCELPTGPVKNWTAFERRDPDFADAARLFLGECEIPLPPGVPAPETVAEDVPEMAILIPVLDRYIRHRLLRSEDPDDHVLARSAIKRLRLIGVQITETGARACASPVSRVMAYSRSKMAALVPILREEKGKLGERIRAVVVADYEKSSAVKEEVGNPLDEEAGGAIAAFRALLTDPETDALDPVLVTGSTVLVDDDLSDRFRSEAIRWLEAQNLDVDLSYGAEDGFNVLYGRGADWCPRVYVKMITDLFQRGLTRCLVGTRGLLGEGWDAEKVNVLVDLTTVTTSMSVNQLRGRSIRLDPDDAQKLANNWDVVCLAPEFRKGLDDYGRFRAKHQTVFGATDDGAIEKGVGHVHPAFTELKPEGVEGAMGPLNTDMLERAGRRADFRSLWRIGEPYHPEPIHALETRTLAGGGGSGFPPFAGASDPWSSETLTLAIGQAMLGSLCEAKLLSSSSAIHAGSRAGGYVRVFLEKAGEEDNRLFTRCMAEALGQLRRPRYVIPRFVHTYRDTWLSRVLPVFIGRHFRKRRSERVMLHAVPSVLAKSKELAAIYQRHWNEHVSPGEAIYAHRGEGEELVEEMRRAGLVPAGEIHRKEVFM